MPRQETPQPPIPRVGNILLLIAQTLAVTVEVFIRRRMGSRYLDVQGALALLVIPFYGAGAWPHKDLHPLMAFLGLYFITCSIVRLNSLKRRFHGEEQHTRYSGRPVIMSLPLFRKVSERKIKTIVEPVLVFVIGSLTTIGNEPLGTFWMVAAVGLFMSEGYRVAHQHRRIMDIKDSIEEQRIMSDLFRQFRK